MAATTFHGARPGEAQTTRRLTRTLRIGATMLLATACGQTPARIDQVELSRSAVAVAQHEITRTFSVRAQEEPPRTAEEERFLRFWERLLEEGWEGEAEEEPSDEALPEIPPEEPGPEESDEEAIAIEEEEPTEEELSLEEEALAMAEEIEDLGGAVDELEMQNSALQEGLAVREQGDFILGLGVSVAQQREAILGFILSLQAAAASRLFLPPPALQPPVAPRSPTSPLDQSPFGDPFAMPPSSQAPFGDPFAMPPSTQAPFGDPFAAQPPGGNPFTPAPFSMETQR